MQKFHFRFPVILAITLASGVFIGATFFGSSPTDERDLVRSFLKFREVISYINNDYVDSVDAEDLVDYSIAKMLEKLDPHSVYIPASELNDAKQALESNFEGIGIEFAIIKDTLRVVLPLTGGPSETAGIRSGDRIIAVDGENIAGVGLTNTRVFKLLKGPKGTEVDLTIRRKSAKKPLDFTITRDKIPTYSVDVGYMVDDKTGYIKVSRFARNTYQETLEKLEDLKAQGAKQLILDLRSNSGGYMDRATNIADEFLGGNKLIVYTDGKEDRYDSKIFALRSGMFEKEPLIVLVDEQSASASEIVAGALQDNDRALIVGRRTFGKGLVQMPIPIKADNSELRLTISRYYTPSGRSIQKPYSEDDIYERDLNERYKHGEFFTADSIKFSDSLKYTTLNGRTVYGGGGIMPDIFIPLDTMYSSSYLSQLLYSGVFREFTLDASNKIKKEWESQGFKSFQKEFVVTDAMLDQVIELAQAEEIEFDEDGFNRSEPLIKNYIKAYIARNIWKNEGFYPILHQKDRTFQKALKLFDKAEALAAGNFEDLENAE